ncbi:MAG: aminotransferase class V-fold PLP-dependent enzyme [Treponemataceae bacterium]|nr:MAG: aminotransferase class V-fold PLP-dependent enzyme [Treponemataceae bacterium]
MIRRTQLIHTGHEIDPETGAMTLPVYQVSTFDQGDLSKPVRFDYARSGNPTRQAVEQTIALLEGEGSESARGFAFSSGIAAIASTLGIFASGDHIIAAEDIYGGSYRILNTFFKRWGLETTAVDASNPENIARAVRRNTKAVFLETPSNPLLKITDLAACAKTAKDAGLVVIVDNTFMTPLLQRPLALGADIVLHSATKFLGGHSDVIFGFAVTNDAELAGRIYQVQNGFGAVPGPWDCYLVERGIKSLAVRLEAEQASAQKLAEWLVSRKNVEAVYYPGLAGHLGRGIHERQADGAGAVLSFKTQTAEQAVKFLGTVKLAAAAVSLGGVETITSYPVRMSHAAMPKEERERLGITDTLIRVSVGLEGIGDIIADFDEALA